MIETTSLSIETSYIQTDIFINMESRTSSSSTSIIIPRINRSKVISTVMNNPITFLLSQFHHPSNLLSIFTSPIPVSFPLQRSQFTRAELLVLITLIVAGSVVGLTIMWMLIIVSSPIWIPAAVALSLLAVGLFSVFGLGAVATVSVTWIGGRFFPTHAPPCVSARETPLEKNQSTLA